MTREPGEGPANPKALPVTSKIPMRSLLLIVLLHLSACRAPVSWHGEHSTHGLRWRGHSAYVGEFDTILATSEASAEDALRFMGELRARLASEVDLQPGRGLIIAVAFDDPVVLEELEELEDPEEYMCAVALLHTRALGVALNTEAALLAEGGDSQDSQISEETVQRIRTLFTRSMAGALPADAEEINLPPALTDSAAWVFMLPTDDCLDEVVDRMITIAVAESDLGFAQRAVFALIRGRVEEKFAQQVGQFRSIFLWHLLYVIGGLDKGKEPERAAALARICGAQGPAGLGSTEEFSE